MTFEKISPLKVLAIDSGDKESPTMANVFMYPKNELNGEVFEVNERREYFVVEDNQLRQPILGRQVGQLSLKRSDVTLEIVDGDPKELFEVTNDGLVKTKKVIDREERDKFTLTLVAKNDRGFDQKVIDILVKDVNDNIPTFDENDLNELIVDQSAPIGN